MRPGSDQGLMDLHPSLVPSKGDTLGTKGKGPEFLQSREEIVTERDPMRITEKGQKWKGQGLEYNVCTKACQYNRLWNLLRSNKAE